MTPCFLCSELSNRLEVVLYSQESPQQAAYLLLQDEVIFDGAKVAKFASFCASNGVALQRTQIMDVCERCLGAARTRLN